MKRQRRPFKLTRAGWVFILYTIGVGAGAINTGNNLLYLVFGLFLGLLLASGVLSDLSLWGVRVTLAFPSFAPSKEISVLPFQLSNTKKYFSSFSVVVEFEGLLRGQTLLMKSHTALVGPSERTAGLVRMVFPKRGRFQLSKIRLSTQYPFGLLKKWWPIDSRSMTWDDVFVLPELIPMNLNELPLVVHGSDVDDKVFHKGDGATFHSLREFQYDDHPRFIDWKASAKRSRAAVDDPSWVVREMEEEQRQKWVLILPSATELDAWSAEKIEKLVQVIYSLWSTCQKAGQEIVLIGKNRPDAMFVVRDEKIFFSLWDPREPLSDILRSVIEPTTAELILGRGNTLSAVEVFQRYG